MILIITNEADFSTNVVIDWLHFYGLKYIRVNREDKLNIVFDNDDIIFINQDFRFSFNEIKCVWYRRGLLNFDYNSVGDVNIDNFLKTETKKIKEFIYYKISNLPSINDFNNSDVNKLIVNDFAKKVGLKVPFEKIISNKESLKKLRAKHKLATKSISGSSMFYYENFYLVGYTSLINKKTKVTDNFFPSLVQKYIEKKYEIRVFYLNGKIWSMAIFSQLDEQTRIDFRNYNNLNPNRNISFNLPDKIKVKLNNLMEVLKINCGSIDMILTNENEYYFLEVNPIGQFGMVSNPCNFNLHREIALNLKELYEK